MSRSTCVKDIKTNGNDLLIMFPSGAVYAYQGAGHLLSQAALSESLGQWFNTHIKNGGFRCIRFA